MSIRNLGGGGAGAGGSDQGLPNDRKAKKNPTVKGLGALSLVSSLVQHFATVAVAESGRNFMLTRATAATRKQEQREPRDFDIP